MGKPDWLKSALLNDKKYLTRKRFYWQAAFAVLLNLSIALTGFAALRWICVPVLNCWACPWAVFGCPAGAMANMAALGLVAFGVIGILVSFAVFLGRWTCGWACPFGWLQELFYMIPLPKIEIPRWMRFGKYIVLALMVLLFPFISGGGTVAPDDLKPLQEAGSTDAAQDTSLKVFLAKKLFICYYCPAGTIEASVPTAISATPLQDRVDAQRRRDILVAGLDPEKVADDDPTYPRKLVARTPVLFDKWLIAGLFLLLFVIIKRPFCRIACPVGAALGIFTPVSVLRLKVDEKKCINCDACTKRCPQGISIYKPDCTRTECILCNECVVVCPTKAISYENPIAAVKSVGKDATCPKG
ncbi:MAG: 4Fe-4S binding protein [Candidatus Brocadiia bacterium]